jgi:hypothetical protein
VEEGEDKGALDCREIDVDVLFLEVGGLLKGHLASIPASVVADEDNDGDNCGEAEGEAEDEPHLVALLGILEGDDHVGALSVGAADERQHDVAALSDHREGDLPGGDQFGRGEVGGGVVGVKGAGQVPGDAFELEVEFDAVGGGDFLAIDDDGGRRVRDAEVGGGGAVESGDVLLVLLHGLHQVAAGLAVLAGWAGGTLAAGGQGQSPGAAEADGAVGGAGDEP